MTVRRLETTIADMQAKMAGHSGEVAKKAAEIERLMGELRKAQVTVLRFQARELMRRSTTRTIVKFVLYLYERSQRSVRLLSMGHRAWVPAPGSPSRVRDGVPLAGTTAEDAANSSALTSS
jgi:hypothetical protein